MSQKTAGIRDIVPNTEFCGDGTMVKSEIHSSERHIRLS